LEIFEPEQKWSLYREYFEGFGHLPQHPLLGYPLTTPQQRWQVLRCDESGHLRQPGRCIAVEYVYELMTADFTA
jgi:hypothetical protein